MQERQAKKIPKTGSTVHGIKFHRHVLMAPDTERPNRKRPKALPRNSASPRLSHLNQSGGGDFWKPSPYLPDGRKGIVRYQPKGHHVLGPIRSDAPCRECVQPGLNMKGNIKMVKNILTGRLGIQLGMTPVQESRFNVPYRERRRKWSQKN